MLNTKIIQAYFSVHISSLFCGFQQLWTFINLQIQILLIQKRHLVLYSELGSLPIFKLIGGIKRVVIQSNWLFIHLTILITVQITHPLHQPSHNVLLLTSNLGTILGCYVMHIFFLEHIALEMAVKSPNFPFYCLKFFSESHIISSPIYNINKW